MFNKRGLSGIVTVVILVALSVALVAVVWGVVQNMIEKNLDEASSCSNLLTGNSIELNNDYTCNDSSIYFAIDVGDLDVDAILVKIEGRATTKTYKLDSGTSSSALVLYTGESAHIPNKNSGLTYNLSIVDEGLVGPYNVAITPIINGHTCDESSRINVIDDCSLIPNFP